MSYFRSCDRIEWILPYKPYKAVVNQSISSFFIKGVKAKNEIYFFVKGARIIFYRISLSKDYVFIQNKLEVGQH